MKIAKIIIPTLLFFSSSCEKPAAVTETITQEELNLKQKEAELKYKELELQAKAEQLKQTETQSEAMVQKQPPQKKTSRQVISSNESYIDDHDASQIIYNFVSAEDNRNFSQLYNYLSPNMTRYWAIKNPTYKQLYKTYQTSWEKLTYSNNDIQEIERVNGNTFDMYTHFTYLGRNTGENKTIANTIRFKINQNYEIYYINEN